MTRNQMVQGLLDRAAALVKGGAGDDEISADEAAGVVQDAIAGRQQDEAEAAFSGNGDEPEGDSDDTPTDAADGSFDDEAEDYGPVVVVVNGDATERQKYEPNDPEAEATFGQKLLLQRLAEYSNGEGDFKLLYPAGSTNRAIVDGKWNAGLAFHAISAMLAYERWNHPEGYSLVPNEGAVDKFHANADKAA